MISKELEVYQQSIHQLATTKLENLQIRENSTKTKLKKLHDAMEVLTVDLNSEITNLLNDIEEMVKDVYKDEMENLEVLVSGFQAPFFNDPAVLNLYKQHIIRYWYFQFYVASSFNKYHKYH